MAPNAAKPNGGVLAILFDIDGTLITTGGTSAVAWRRAFADLYEIPVNVGEFTHAGMTDPEVCRLTFTAVIGHDPTAPELAQLMAKRLEHLPAAVAESTGYRVLPGVPELLPSLVHRGYLLGLTTGLVESAAHIKLARGDLNKYFHVGGYGSDSPDRTELTRCGIQRAGAVLARPWIPTTSGSSATPHLTSRPRTALAPSPAAGTAPTHSAMPARITSCPRSPMSSRCARTVRDNPPRAVVKCTGIMLRLGRPNPPRRWFRR
jgi:hypothetical protein